MEAHEDPFPAPSKEAVGLVDGVETQASSTFFSDKIMVTLSQEGRLSQWIQVSLSAPSAASVDMALPDTSLLPLPHLTPKTLLGGGGEERESSGQLYAVHIASFIARKDSDEKRTLLVGLGLLKPKPDRESFFDVIELIQNIV
ncbi:putative Proteasome assembly chaperone 3 [Seiridium cardinale]|uniref:Proteasome assembly chaperone 3 n=1 Tax=Seiridium cardinale TaxID=138064 RepID=A0ABR2X635_9PEZI